MITAEDASKLSPSEQLSIMRDIWYANAINTSTQFQTTGDLKKGLAASSFSRVHRMYLKDQLKFTSTPQAPKENPVPEVKPKRKYTKRTIK